MNRENDDILAVLSAVIAAISTQPGHKLVVKSFKRLPQVSPVWNVTGRIEQIRNKKNH